MVLPSCKKIRSEVMKRRFVPSNWLRTGCVFLNTVRWGGAYLCGMGEGWSVDRSSFRLRSNSGHLIRNECGELLESFLSRKMVVVRQILQQVEWDMNVENAGREFLSIE